MTFNELVACWQAEITRDAHRPFSLRRCLRRVRTKRIAHYLFWFRLAQYLHRKRGRLLNYERMAYRIQSRLISRHNIEIMLEASIGPGLRIYHMTGIVITGITRIGKNLKLRQNTTIGIVGRHPVSIEIGDNVDIGANSVILGDDLRIGHNVTIGAMAFINRDVPDDTVVFTEHRMRMRPQAEKLPSLADA